MSDHSPRFSLDQIGTGVVRFPSGAPIPTQSDKGVDPYFETRISKDVHIAGVMFWPQGTETFPGIVILHEAWGLNEQIKNTAHRLACEGFVILLPNLYGRLGGMVTAHAELAQTLMSRINEKDLLQDINSCCEFLNTRDHVKRNIHGAVGFGMGGSLALQFACHRRRLRAAVSFYGRMFTPEDGLKDLRCPLLYHQAGADDWVPADDATRLQKAAKQFDKRVEVRLYPDAPHAFCNDTRKDVYNPAAANEAWAATVEFLNDSFKGL